MISRFPSRAFLPSAGGGFLLSRLLLLPSARGHCCASRFRSFRQARLSLKAVRDMQTHFLNLTTVLDRSSRVLCCNLEKCKNSNRVKHLALFSLLLHIKVASATVVEQLIAKLILFNLQFNSILSPIESTLVKT